MTFRSYFLAMLLAIAALSVTGCSDDPASPPDDSITVTIDGLVWSAETIRGLKNGTQVSFTGTSADGTLISISFPTLTEKGTLTINQFIGTCTTGGKTYLTNLVSPATGTATITDFSDDWFSGTFEFSAANGQGSTIVVTEGDFSVNF